MSYEEFMNKRYSLDAIRPLAFSLTGNQTQAQELAEESKHIIFQSLRIKPATFSGHPLKFIVCGLFYLLSVRKHGVEGRFRQREISVKMGMNERTVRHSVKFWLGKFPMLFKDFSVSKNGDVMYVGKGKEENA